ncbi:Farnesol dehydrogenase [Eumeta japonica]|uniref:Farnesol dehydrogenase n=1 Tax=Eumeta variegata TaxID=151549 RepID=A0A4C1UXC1_EUMVA|nr:Farnesol dehydrogenase [Eumeta japonica]
MEVWRRKIAVVTGAGAGIGERIADDLIKAGMTVICFEPTQAKVDAMCKKLECQEKSTGQLVPCRCDISKEYDLKAAFEGIVDVYKGVDLLVNNAAVGMNDLMSTGNLDNFKKIIDVNIYGLIACTRYAIQSMAKHKKCGYIININSICGHYMPPLPEPKFNVYIATKQAMTAATTLLRNEIKASGAKIKVTSLSPGVVRTGVFKAVKMDFMNDEFLEKNPTLSPQDVSEVVHMVLSMPRGVQINEIIFHALHEIF